MELLWKGIGISLLTCILIVLLGKQEKDMSAILSVAGAAAILIITVSYLKPVIQFLIELSELASLNSDHLSVLLKASGVGLITEIAALVCTDSGNAGIGNTLRFLGAAVILWLSVPVFQALLQLIGTILEGI